MVWLQKYEGQGARRDKLLEAGLTWFKLESTLFFQVWQNNRLFLDLSSSLQPWFKVWLCCFLPWVHKISHWGIIFCTGSQCRRYGGPGAEPARGGFRGYTSYPGAGLGGPGRVQVSALSFGVAPSVVFIGLNLSKICSSPNFGQKIGLNWQKIRLKFSYDLFFAPHLIFRKKSD